MASMANGSALAGNGPYARASPTRSTASSATDNLQVLRQVHIVRQYLQRSDDASIALSCLPALIKVGSIIDDGRDPGQLFYLLETVAIALEVLRNHDQGPDMSVRASIRDYVDGLNTNKFTASHPADFEIPFLLKRLRSALAMCCEQTHQGDTFGGLVYDTASILLSQFKYDVSPSVVSF